MVNFRPLRRLGRYWWLVAALGGVLVAGLALVLRSRRPVEMAITVTATPSPMGTFPPPATLRPPTLTPAPTYTPSPTLTPTPPGGGGVIAYTLNGDLMVADVTTGRSIRLTSNPGPERDPTWSPDGRSLAFSARWDGNWDLYRLDLADGHITRLTDDLAYEGHPAWSPNGQTIAFETMREGNLDIYVMPAEGGATETQRPLVTSPAVETSPAWSPDSRWLVYSAHANGQRDLFLIPAEGGKPINLTHSSDQQEDDPAFSSDGRELAYTVEPGGERDVYIAPIDIQAGRLMTESARLVGKGVSPAWSPDAASLAYAVPSRRSPRVQVGSIAGYGWSDMTFPADLPAGHPAWSPAFSLPFRLPFGSAGAGGGDVAPTPVPEPTPLYVEHVAPTPASGPPYSFVYVPVRTGGPYLSDRVDDSFRALRQRVIDETGYDYLSVFGDMWRGLDAYARPGQSERSWHKAGRAFDINQGPYPPGQDVVVVLEESSGRTFWRVYFRTAYQDGRQGEPLHVAPWDFSAQPGAAGDAPTGGAPRHLIPRGYWLDFTSLAAEYGWLSVSALDRWRTYYPDTDWWHFQKTDGLTWFEAMSEVYTPEDIMNEFGAER